MLNNHIHKYLQSTNSISISLFRKLVMANTSVVITAKLTESKGRKLFMSAVMRSPDDEILVESSALFITMQKEQQVVAPSE